MQNKYDDVEKVFDIFLSYSRKNSNIAVTLAKALEERGLRVFLDRYMISKDLWQTLLKVNIIKSKHVLVLWSQPATKSLNVLFEAETAKALGKYTPFRLEECNIPDIVSDKNAPLLPDPVAEIETILAAIDHDPLTALQLYGPGKRTSTDHTDIDLVDMPISGTMLYGRDIELEKLTKAWDGRETNLILFRAMGGAGKTALINRFLTDMTDEDWCGAQKVFAYSFYLQGSSEDRNVSADPFFSAALEFFGHDLDANPIKDQRKKGRTLINLVRKQRALVVLDGLEPMQGLPDVNMGRLRDSGLKYFIENMAADNPGLLVITSRQPIVELNGKGDAPRIIRHDLGKLTPQAGAAYLAHLGVTGRPARGSDPAELETVSEEYGGHALALTLLGNYLTTVHGGDASHRNEIASIFDDPQQGGHATRVMRSYIKRFEELDQKQSRGEGQIELMALRILGLFDRKAEKAAIDAVLAEPAIENLTDVWHSLSAPAKEQQWMFALQRLRSLGLIAGDAKNSSLDAHPLVREYFDQHLQENRKDAYIAAHNRLYQHYKFIKYVRLDNNTSALVPISQQANELLTKYGAYVLHVLLQVVDGRTYLDKLCDENREDTRTRLQLIKKQPQLVGLLTKLAEQYSAELLMAIKMLDTLPEKDAAELAAQIPDKLLPLREMFADISEETMQLILVTQPAVWQILSSLPDDIAVFSVQKFAELKVAMTELFPDNIEAMAPQFQAISHGCKAELEEQVYNDIYWPTIEHGNKNFISNQLGSNTSKLALLARFFDQPYASLPDNISDERKGQLFNMVGYALRAVGRLGDAVEPFTAALHLAKQNEDWINAASQASNNSELLLSIGEIKAAIKAGREAVELIDSKTSDTFGQIGYRTTLAVALFQAGQGQEVNDLFQDAANRQQKRQPSKPLLYSVQGFRYCDWQLARGEAAQAMDHAQQTLQWVTIQDWLLDMAVDNLSLGSAHHLQALQSLFRGTPRDNDLTLFPFPLVTPDAVAVKQLAKAKKHLNEAVTGLEKAGAEHHQPRGLLARAAYYRTMGEVKKANADIKEAWEIAERGGMKLFMADCQLEWARLILCADPIKQRAGAQKALANATKIISATGYNRRLPELQALQSALDDLV